MMHPDQIAVPTCESNKCLTSERKLTAMEQLQLKRSRLQDQLADVDKTIELFTKNPELEQCLTMVRELILTINKDKEQYMIR